MSAPAPLPLLLLRKKRKVDATVSEINNALAEASSSSSDEEEHATLPLSKSYFLKRIVSSKKSLSIYVVLRSDATNERLSAADLGACSGRLSVVLRTRAAVVGVRVKTSIVLDYVDSVVLFNAEFSPPLTAAFAVTCALDGAPLRSAAAAAAADTAEFVHELVRFDPHCRISPSKPPAAAKSSASKKIKA